MGRTRPAGPGRDEDKTGASLAAAADRQNMLPFLPPDYDPESLEGMRLGLSWWLIGTGRLWRRLLDEKLRFSDQTQPRWRVLAWARMLPGIKQAQLAERMGIAGPTLVRILDGLERQGMIERRDSPDDRRVKEIHLTAQARPVVEQISAQVNEVRDMLLQDISAEELRVSLSVMERIRARIAEASTPGALATGDDD